MQIVTLIPSISSLPATSTGSGQPIKYCPPDRQECAKPNVSQIHLQSQYNRKNDTVWKRM